MGNYDFFESILNAVCEDTYYDVSGNEASPNREYKDTVFKMIFQDKGKLLSLYNAVGDRHYADPEQLEIVTLENAIYLKVRNDIAFLIDFHLHLYEHQSTINPNMPLRFLQYVTAEFGKLTVGENFYGSKQILLPTPHFVVFYNGTEPQPEERTLRLSDAYKVSESEVQLELQVKILNINDGFNEELKTQCKTLKEYMQFVNRVRKYKSFLPLAEAMRRAVEECIKEDILADFLRENQLNAELWTIYGYDEENVNNALKEEAYKAGEIMGKQAGVMEGKKVGKVMGKAEAVLELLEELGSVPEDIRKLVTSQEDLKLLQQWLKAAAKAESIEEWKSLVDWDD